MIGILSIGKGEWEEWVVGFCHPNGEMHTFLNRYSTPRGALNGARRYAKIHNTRCNASVKKIEEELKKSASKKTARRRA